MYLQYEYVLYIYINIVHERRYKIWQKEIKPRNYFTCEQAPAGYKVKIDFLSFSVGTGNEISCEQDDFVLIDHTGDPSFSTDTHILCGSAASILNESYSSHGMNITIMGNGRAGGQAGFTAQYSVVPMGIHIEDAAIA